MADGGGLLDADGVTYVCVVKVEEGAAAHGACPLQYGHQMKKAEVQEYRTACDVVIRAKSYKAGDFISVGQRVQGRMVTLHHELHEGYCYFVVTSEDYPPRYAQKCMSELIAEVRKLGQQLAAWQQSPTEDGFSRKMARPLKGLLMRYADIDSLDKAMAMQKKVDGVTSTMQDTIHTAVGNVQSLDDLQESTANLQSGAKMFTKQARKSRRAMCLKNMKLNAIIFLIVVVVLWEVTSSLHPWGSKN